LYNKVNRRESTAQYFRKSDYMQTLLHRISRHSILLLILVIINIFAWYPVLNFWFFRGWEQSWLIGVCGYSFNLLCLMKGHGFLYLLNYTLFGWNPTGWYFTAIVLHILTVLLVFKFTHFLTKSTLFAFITALLFGVNVAHNDVVTWGSFEALYALMMGLFILAIFTYLRFKQDASPLRYLWYALTIVIFLFGLFVRESAILLPMYIVLTDLFVTFTPRFINSSRSKKKTIPDIKKYLRFFIPTFLPFFLLTIGYLLFRSWYGGAPHDQIDAMVLLRGALIAQGRYVEYIWRGLLAFGKFAAAHVIPYPILNIVRDILFRFLPLDGIRLYFFPFVGFVYTLIQPAIIWLCRKNTSLRNILIFSFLWFLLPTFFFSFAFSITDYMLEGAYQWDSSRWRYFALFGTLVFWISLGFQIYKFLSKRYVQNKRYIRNSTIAIIAGYFLLNFFLLRSIEREMYLNTFKPPRDFYTKFLQEFQTLPKEYVFYNYPYASPLNDFLSEWYYLRQAYYPYLSENRSAEFSEAHMGMLMERFINKTADINNTYFLDYNYIDGLQNKTEQTKKMILGQGEQTYEIGKTIPSLPFADLQKPGAHQLTIPVVPKIHVETPYAVEITLSGLPGEYSGDAELATVFERFVANRMDFLKQATIEVCKTAPIGARGAPAMYLLPENMINGNFGRRSLWVADCKPAWVTIDLGNEKTIGGLAFYAGKNATNVPSTYSISVSSDGKTWETADSTDGNTSIQRIHLFKTPVQARYVKFTVDQTTEGQMVTLDAVEVISAEDTRLAGTYTNDFLKLIYDSYAYGSGVLRLSWDTEPNNWQPDETMEYNSFYALFPQNGTEQIIRIEPNESEYFSTSTQFLKRYITKLHFDVTGKPGETSISSVRLIPKYPLVEGMRSIVSE
jgi:hypothetical protein